MADFTLSKSLFSGKYRNASSTHGNIAYALFVLFCFWAGAQLLNLLVHAPGVYERLMQVRGNRSPTGGNWFRCRHHFRADPVFSRLPHFCSGGAMAALATSPPVSFTLSDAA